MAPLQRSAASSDSDSQENEGFSVSSNSSSSPSRGDSNAAPKLLHLAKSYPTRRTAALDLHRVVSHSPNSKKGKEPLILDIQTEKSNINVNHSSSPSTANPTPLLQLTVTVTGHKPSNRPDPHPSEVRHKLQDEEEGEEAPSSSSKPHHPSLAPLFGKPFARPPNPPCYPNWSWRNPFSKEWKFGASLSLSKLIRHCFVPQLRKPANGRETSPEPMHIDVYLILPVYVLTFARVVHSGDRHGTMYFPPHWKDRFMVQG
ncbi:hypothetical protein CC78DRAFT_585425 [Lojkania enalia]|uniref:Uncharacterized protein n=1 Tax=Lojkania enalia TaxID=147567 RepID=A0A9P4K0G3_9PLEO|nr:hypothetical protein CC78DRAFT_585425 [Didymosphaeria enalia]